MSHLVNLQRQGSLDLLMEIIQNEDSVHAEREDHRIALIQNMLEAECMLVDKATNNQTYLLSEDIYHDPALTTSPSLSPGQESVSSHVSHKSSSTLLTETSYAPYSAAQINSLQNLCKPMKLFPSSKIVKFNSVEKKRHAIDGDEASGEDFHLPKKARQITPTRRTLNDLEREKSELEDKNVQLENLLITMKSVINQGKYEIEYHKKFTLFPRSQ